MEKLNKKFYPLALTYFRLLNLIKVEGSSQSENDVHGRIDSFGRKLYFFKCYKSKYYHVILTTYTTYSYVCMHLYPLNSNLHSHFKFCSPSKRVPVHILEFIWSIRLSLSLVINIRYIWHYILFKYRWSHDSDKS